MKFLELPQISSFNSLMGNLGAPDGTKIQGRLEVFTCKAAGNDKKLLKQLESKYTNTEGSESEEVVEADNSSPLKSNQLILVLLQMPLLNCLEFTKEHSDFTPGSPSQAIINPSNGLNVKTFYYLVSTMNNMFPDYDFW